jgi:predicted ATPase
MINKISFKNYKLFKEEQTIELKPITILIGKNNSGKSALAKLPTLISGSLSGEFDEPVRWENEGVELGSEIRDLIYEKSASGDIEFKIENNDKFLDLKLTLLKDSNANFYSKITYWNFNNEIELKYNVLTDKYKNLIDNTEVECRFKGFVLENIDNNDKILTPIFENFDFDYIGAYRAIPDNKGYEKPKEKIIEKVGIKGEDAYSILVNDYLNDDKLLLSRISQWYKENFDGWGINIDSSDSKRNLYYFDLERKAPRKTSISLKFVGQGMGQILPLVTRAFMNVDKPILTIIEEPELHLHPSAHGDLAELFVSSLENSNKNYLIETHSENFILRLRRLIAEGSYDFFTEEKIKIYYVNYNEENNESFLDEVFVDNNGNVKNWPKKIFSESLDELIAIKNAKK